jgi:DNA-binding NarL/FixJ family response regulator
MSSAHISKPATIVQFSATRGKPAPNARVLLADDNPDILDHVSDILQAEYEIVGKVSDGNMVCAEVEKIRPDLVVLDISMGERSGIEIAQRLREHGYAGEIVFLTVHEDPDFVTAAMGAGGRGYVMKSRMNDDLGKAMKAVLSNRIFISACLR